MVRNIHWILLFVGITIFPHISQAQNLTVSPYSRYGLGDIINNSTVRNAAMGGIGTATNNYFGVNRINPASYADLLYTTLDVSGFGQGSRLKTSDAATAETQYTAGLQNLSFAFPSNKKLAIAFGFAPYTSIGYDISSTYDVQLQEDTVLTGVSNYQADGGLNQAFIGIAGKLWKGKIRIGGNFTYAFGSTQYGWQSFVANNTQYIPTSLTERVFLNGISGQLGVMVTDTIKGGYRWRLGATAEYSTNMTGSRLRILTNGFVTDSLGGEATGTVSLPPKFSAGVGFEKLNKWFIGADVVMQDWSNFRYFEDSTNFNQDLRIAIGGEILPNWQGKYMARIKYRLGAYYHNSYFSFNNAPVNDYGVTFGFGFPTKGLRRAFRNGATVNIGFEVGKRGSLNDHPLEEIYGKVRIGININEQWFQRRVID